MVGLTSTDAGQFVPNCLPAEGAAAFRGASTSSQELFPGSGMRKATRVVGQIDASS
jgi:hypothetical protein